MDSWIDLFIEAIIAVALFGPLNDYINSINATGTVGVLLSLIPVLYVIVLVAVFAYAVKRRKGK
jgi:uncharacterized membrane protein